MTGDLRKIFDTFAKDSRLSHGLCRSRDMHERRHLAQLLLALLTKVRTENGTRVGETKRVKSTKTQRQAHEDQGRGDSGQFDTRAKLR